MSRVCLLSLVYFAVVSAASNTEEKVIKKFFQGSVAMLCAEYGDGDNEKLLKCVSCKAEQKEKGKTEDEAAIYCFKRLVDRSMQRKCKDEVKAVEDAIDEIENDEEIDLELWVSLLKCTNRILFDNVVEQCVDEVGDSAEEDEENYKNIMGCVNNSLRDEIKPLKALKEQSGDESGGSGRKKRPSRSDRRFKREMVKFRVQTYCQQSDPEGSQREIRKCVRCFQNVLKEGGMESEEGREVMVGCVQIFLDETFSECGELVEEEADKGDIKSCFHLAMWKNFLSEALDENDGEIVGKNLQEKYKKVSALTMEKILEFVQEEAPSSIRSFLVASLRMHDY